MGKFRFSSHLSHLFNPTSDRATGRRAVTSDRGADFLGFVVIYVIQERKIESASPLSPPGGSGVAWHGVRLRRLVTDGDRLRLDDSPEADPARFVGTWSADYARPRDNGLFSRDLGPTFIGDESLAQRRRLL